MLFFITKKGNLSSRRSPCRLRACPGANAEEKMQNHYLTDAELDAIEGSFIDLVQPPTGYATTRPLTNISAFAPELAGSHIRESSDTAEAAAAAGLAPELPAEIPGIVLPFSRPKTRNILPRS